ncbi:MAG: DNA cytosine methyltransferase [candidate division Zixibacteria bacterium]|nr:DNA cytosine methyltransferase [candidate division Zixibacteria bacterium]
MRSSQRVLGISRLTAPSQATTEHAQSTKKPHLLDFFAGSGLVSEALKPYFDPVWANDICKKKAAVYCANHPPDGFQPGPIERIRGKDLPTAVLSWASFPCQDLSLAGNLRGIHSKRSGLVWEWLRVMDEMPSRPPIVVAENVTGLISAHGGGNYRALHLALVDRGYKVGALMLDAAHWLPHSRPRVFIVGVDRHIATEDLESKGPGWVHPRAIISVASQLPQWVWWYLPEPRNRKIHLNDLIDFEAPCHAREITTRTLQLVPRKHRQALQDARAKGIVAFPGYKRIREGRQVLELRFDGVAGCLRTPQGGSSRQVVVLWKDDGHLATRLLTVRETARLMGARESYRIPGSYNDGYRAMGDAVAVPPVRHLARFLLSPLAHRCR